MSESKRPRGKYKTTNWANYNASLKARGSLTVWLDKDLQWYAGYRQTGPSTHLL